MNAEWVSPEYSRTRVDKAGRVLVDPDANLFTVTDALEVLNNWRASHNCPLNGIQMLLRMRARRVDPSGLIVQRLKRVPSIVQKLARFPSMKLSQMQDIGGCRAVVDTTEHASLLRDAFLDAGKAKHRLTTHKDYVAQPKSSGYRSIHMVYRYVSATHPEFNGHLIEVQIRSKIQHSWAAAVETVGTILGQALKASEGPERWLRFFALTSSAFAGLEHCPQVPDTPTGDELNRQIRTETAALRVHDTLTGYRLALRVLRERGTKRAHYYLLVLDFSQRRLQIKPYPQNKLEKASEDYLNIERTFTDNPRAQAVLVRADSIDALQRAYPNYFLDTEAFLETLDAIG
jgi:hypothetical protein